MHVYMYYIYRYMHGPVAHANKKKVATPTGLKMALPTMWLTHLYSRLFHPRQPRLKGGYEPGEKRFSPPVLVAAVKLVSPLSLYLPTFIAH